MDLSFLASPAFWAFVGLVTIIFLSIYFVEYQAKVDAIRDERRANDKKPGSH